MKLLTKELEKQLTEAGKSEEEGTVALAHFFNPTGAGDWYALEYFPENKIFFGYVSIHKDHDDEFGDFSLDELESYKGFGGLGIEREIHFTPQPIEKIIKELHGE